jgi:short-subunit dehydrogenase
VDVTSQQEVFDLVARTGRLDYMFNNAGICIQGEVRDMTMEMWRKIVDVNLWGVVYGTMAAYPVMIRQGSGHIVNVASAAGLIAFPTQVAYSTTKHAVVGLSGALRVEAEQFGVNVTVVCPGFIDTNIAKTTPVLKARMEDVLARVPFKMLPADWLARVVLRGVARNRALIVAPFYARVMWWLSWLFPGFMQKTLGRKMVRDFRALRIDD